MDIFTYAANEERYFERLLEDNGYGYKRISTFYADLSIAECFGTKNVKDTYNDVCRVWVSDYKMFTEFVLCLNYKCWEMYGKGREALSRLYSDLYYKAVDKFYEYWGENGKNDAEALEYYYRTTD